MRVSAMKYRNYKRDCRGAVEELSTGCRERPEVSSDKYDAYFSPLYMLHQLHYVIYSLSFHKAFALAGEAR